MISSARGLLALAVLGGAISAIAAWFGLPAPAAAFLGGALALPIAWLLQRTGRSVAKPVAAPPVPDVPVSPTRGLAHELNNVLTVVMGNADRILKDDGADVRRCATTIYDASERGARLTQELLAAARREASDLPDEPSSVRRVA